MAPGQRQLDGGRCHVPGLTGAVLPLGRLPDGTRLLNDVRMTGDWEAWLDFFAEAVIVTATQAVETAQQLLDLSNQDRYKISGLGRAAASTLQVHRALMEHPIGTSGSLVQKTGITPATVNKALGHLERLGIVKELTAQKRNRLFSYAGYIEIMSRGTELPGR